jgi:hypothetical protein
MRRNRRHNQRRMRKSLSVETLESRNLLTAGPLVISEIMADNDTGLTDEDGDFSDWIEIHNPTNDPVDLTGWSLTDDDSQLQLWQFPAETLNSDEYLVIYASQKDRAVENEQLHTNFGLSSGGEYLALVRDDGVTISDDLNFPKQLRDISYGAETVALLTDDLINESLTPATVLVPTDGSLAETWTATNFDDSTWTAANASIGYDTASQVPTTEVNVNFQTSGAPIPAGYLPDGGSTYADRGNGFFYGWSSNAAGGARDRNSHADQRYDTLNHMNQLTWEIGLPNGSYDVHAVFGDPSHTDSDNDVSIEGTDIIDPDGGDNFDEYDVTVTVNDGRLTITPLVGSYVKISFIEIESSEPPTFHGLFDTDLEATMVGSSSSAYLRVPFNAAAPNELVALTLDTQYDDGFVAYLNGTVVATRNAPANPTFNSTSLTDRSNEDAVTYETIDLTAAIGELVAGTNVLAIHGLNEAAANDDFLMNVKLTGTSPQVVNEQYFTTPTPGEENIVGALGLVGDTRFSVDRGFYDQPFVVEITTNTTDAEIRYTTDGSEPTATTGAVYSTSIPVAGTTTLRAAAFKAGYIPSNVDAQSYIFVDDILTQDNNQPAGYPSTWQGFSADYEMDPDIVNNPTYATRVRDALVAIPSVSITTHVDNLFDSTIGIYQNSQSSGVNWERPASVELIYPNGDDGFQINAGLRIQGGASRIQSRSPKHSFRILFKGIYGDSKLNYPLFGDNGVNQFDTLILRAGYNNSWAHSSGGQRDGATFVTDQWIRDTQLAMGHASADGEFVHLYLNGRYWGLHNLTERPDAAFAAEHLGGIKEDYDALNSGEAVEGDTAAWNTMMSLANAGLASDAAYLQIQDYLDVENLIDYMILNIYSGNQDWDHHNWYAARHRGPDGRYQFFSWDAERSLENPTTNLVDENNNNNPSRLYAQLRDNAEFRLLFADRVHQHFFNDGLLTPAVVAANFQARATEIDVAVIGESARWGDYRRANDPYERDVEWVAEIDRIVNQYIPIRTANVLNQFRGELLPLYPAVDAPAFNQHGGSVNAGFQLNISAPAGTIYYTLDGTDPRAADGNPSATAAIWNAAIAINAATDVQARALDGNDWSAINTASFFINTAATADNFAITEVHYNPHDPTADELLVDPLFDNDDFEFVEFRNLSNETINLENVVVTNGFRFDFTGSNIEQLGPNEYVLIVRNQNAFEARYGNQLAVAGQFASGSLNNNGERIEVIDRFGDAIHDFEYNDGGSWPGRADGTGSSLELTVVGDTDGDPNFYSTASNWRSSTEFAGSPGAAGIGPFEDVIVNEVLTHTDVPLSDRVELFNTTNDPINIGGWFISDANGTLDKFQIPANTTLNGGDYIVFTEADFNSSMGVDPNDFAFSGAHGDDVWLMASDPNGNMIRFADHVEFDAAANGESFGRWPDGEGRLYPMESLTFGLTNSGPRVGTVVISEVMYHPTAPNEQISSDDLEFIEIYNSTNIEVDLTNWQLDDGVNFQFGGVMLESKSALAVLPFDPSDPLNSSRLADFLAFYSLPNADSLIGGYSGKLDNSGERVALLRPDSPPLDEPNFIPLLLEDEVTWNDLAPWPVEPDGAGDSLNRSDVVGWGNSELSWSTGSPTPGVFSTGPTLLSITVNGGKTDPDDLAGKGPQPTNWQQQRSDIFTVQMIFSEEMEIEPADLTLTNLGVNSPVDADVVVPLSVSQIVKTGNTVTLTFEPDDIPEGVYHLVIADTANSVSGNAFDGDSDGEAGGSFTLAPDANNGFYELRSEWSGDLGVSVFDFTTFSYWFGQAIPTAPEYVDTNRDDGVSVFDFTSFSLNFGKQVILPNGFAAMANSPNGQSPGGQTANRNDELLVEEELLPNEMVDTIVRQQRTEPTEFMRVDSEASELDELLEVLADEFRGLE